jgi:hypothetical protein
MMVGTECTDDNSKWSGNATRKNQRNPLNLGNPEELIPGGDQESERVHKGPRSEDSKDEESSVVQIFLFRWLWIVVARIL